MGLRWYLLMALICISVMIGDVCFQELIERL